MITEFYLLANIFNGVSILLTDETLSETIIKVVLRLVELGLMGYGVYKLFQSGTGPRKPSNDDSTEQEKIEHENNKKRNNRSDLEEKYRIRYEQKEKIKNLIKK